MSPSWRSHPRAQIPLSLYRTFARIGGPTQLAHLVSRALVRTLGRALGHTEQAVQGDIGLVMRELATAGPVLRVDQPPALAAFALLLVAVIDGRQRSR